MHALHHGPTPLMGALQLAGHDIAPRCDVALDALHMLDSGFPALLTLRANTRAGGGPCLCDGGGRVGRA
eukprot:6211258-Pleurochrysis_carterae.AAC.3